MPKSFQFAKILSRLGIRGMAYNTTTSPSKYEGCVPTLGSNGKLHPSVVGAGTVTLGGVTAELVTFTTPPTKDTGAANVSIAIDNITKDTGGLALMRDKNLTDVASAPTAFANIKAPATVVSSGTVIAGVVGIASQLEVTNGTDTANETGPGAMPLAVSPSIAQATYLSKLVGGTQTISSQIVLPAAPASDMQTANKKYVDDAVGRIQAIPTNITIWVDPVNGNDGTGARGLMTKPVQTLTQAKQLAQSGDLIVVRPGTYNENDLAKNGVNWYFQAGAKVYYTSGGDSTVAVFNVATNEVCHVFGNGEFYNMHGTSLSRYVLYVRSAAQCVFEGTRIQSALSAIYVDGNAGGYTRIHLTDTLSSDDLSGSGSCAARLVTGDCMLTVDGEIYSDASQFQSGLELGNGSTIPGIGVQIVRCPKITGKYNAIHFINSTRSHVIAQTCWSTHGPAVKVDGGAANIIEGVSDLHANPGGVGSYSTVVITAGHLSLVNTIAYAANLQPIIYLNAASNASPPPYLILKNSELWSSGHGTVAVSASVSGYFNLRIVGAVQSDCVEPTTVIRVGGVWDYVPGGDYTPDGGGGQF